MKDGRDIYTHALELHEYFQGSTSDIQARSRLRPTFTTSGN